MRTYAAILGLFSVLACAAESNPLPGEPIPTSPGMHVVVRPDTGAVVDANVSKAPAVVVLDAASRAKSGVRVTFRVVAGGGKITDSIVATDNSGRAALGSWTLGPTQTDNIVEASATGETNVRFTVSARWPKRLATSAVGACAIVNSRTYCWGDNSHTEFSINFGPVSSLTPVLAMLTTTLVPDELFGSFGSHFCALSASRVGTCWGRNDYGQVAATPFSQAGLTTVPLIGRVWRSLSPGRITTCGVDTAGTGYCWGANQRGEIGNPAVQTSGSSRNPGPTLVPLVRFKQITAGWQHACGIATDDTAYCWGSNVDGQLGIGIADTTRIIPTRVSTTEQFSMLAAAGRHTCGLTLDGRAFCWGQNAYGQLGDGTKTARTTPTAVAGGLRFTSIIATTFFLSALPPELSTPPAVASAAHTCALTETGRAYCWGWNGWGQLGDGTLVDRTTPTPTDGTATFSGLALGEASTCGMRGASVWCWGANAGGQLGDGSTTRRLTPTRVQLP